MSIVIDLDAETVALLRKRAALLETMRQERAPSGSVGHSRGQELVDLTESIQMRLGSLALGQAIALAR